MREFFSGVILTLLLIVVGGLLFVNSGMLSLATTAKPLPMEQTLAAMALRASIGSARERKDPLPNSDDNMMAGARIYREACAGCHGVPGQPRGTFASALFPKPPQLFDKDDMVTDDPEGETYWKVSNGIRLSAMPNFSTMLSDTRRWQVTMLVAHADKITPAMQAVLTER